MDAREVCVIRTGTANLASVLAGLERAGMRSVVTTDPDRVRRADRVVLPGVGALASAMQRLVQNGLVAALTERVETGRPTLAVCLGLQLFARGSEESPGVAGLGILPCRAERFPDSVKVPQLGWNRVEPEAGCRWLERGHAYFANSYRIEKPPPGWLAAFADHGGRFVAALERGDVLACQFHPELSGRWGQRLLGRWCNLRLDPKGGERC